MFNQPILRENPESLWNADEQKEFQRNWQRFISDKRLVKKEEKIIQQCF